MALLIIATLAWAAFAIYEMGGLTLPGWHTVSYFAHEHLWLRVILTAAIFALAPLFWLHASRDIPR